ncbi:MAG: SPOR domain-containing protein [Pseudomonadota bacterium]
MAGIPVRTVLVSVALGLALSGCEDGQLFPPRDAAEPEDSGGGFFSSGEAQVETREVERSDIFGTSESALWDGRPSLGGVWVAHPDVTTPERVRIENTGNGRVIRGALFRRERENPGPPFQVSSDAAEELGMLAGQPQVLSVVVIREEEVEIAPILPTEGDDVGTDLATASDDQIAADELAAAGIDTGAATVDDLAGAESAPEPEPRRPGFFAGLFGSGASQVEPIETEIVADTSDVVTTTTSAATPGVETASLDAAPTAAPVAAAPTSAPRPATSTLRNPFVQVGTFTAEENAEAAAASLREIGIVPSVVSGSNGEREFWRVLVGPMTNAEEQTFMLEQIRTLGYSDAFLAPS